MQYISGKKIYFASDFHLGLPMDDGNHIRESKICDWLNQCALDASHIFLLGDLFDTWFDYKKVVPRGFVRFLGTLASLSDQGIQIGIFTGNHDLWMTDYFQHELQAKVFHETQYFEWNGKQFCLAHGDGLGPDDKGYKRLKKILRNPVCQWLYKGLHPNWGIGLAQYFSHKGAKHVQRAEPFLGEDKEWLVQYAKRKLETRPIDYFVFGHRHLALDITIDSQARYINLGDWIQYNTYAVFDGQELQLLQYPAATPYLNV